MLPFNLLSFVKDRAALGDAMLGILENYSSISLTKGIISQLVQVTFRTLSQLIKNVGSYSLSKDQVNILVVFIRNSFDDPNQMKNSFMAISALMNQDIKTTEFHNLMSYVQKLSITSPYVTALDKSRELYFEYMVSQPSKASKQTERIKYYCTHVSYKRMEGRTSAILMLGDFINNLPKRLMKKDHVTCIWFKLMDQYMKEETAKVKDLIRKTLGLLFYQTDYSMSLIELSIKLLDIKVEHKQPSNNALTTLLMGSESILSFTAVPAKHIPDAMVTSVLPFLCKLLTPEMFKELNEDDKQLQLQDVLLVSLLSAVSNIVATFANKKKALLRENMQDTFWKNIANFLLYSNFDVRLTVSKILGQCFALYQIDSDEYPHIASDPHNIQQLVLNFSKHLNTNDLLYNSHLREINLYAVRNLVYLIQLSSKIPFPFENAMADLKTIAKDTNVVTASHIARWVMGLVGSVANAELQMHPKDRIVGREALLNLMAAIALIPQVKIFEEECVWYFVLKYLSRELNDDQLPSSLVTKTNEVATLIKTSLGYEAYNSRLMQVELDLRMKRRSKTAKEKQQRVINPHKALARKAKKSMAKKIARKRKVQELKLRPTKRIKRPKVNEAL